MKERQHFFYLFLMVWFGWKTFLLFVPFCFIIVSFCICKDFIFFYLFFFFCTMRWYEDTSLAWHYWIFVHCARLLLWCCENMLRVVLFLFLISFEMLSWMEGKCLMLKEIRYNELVAKWDSWLISIEVVKWFLN